MEQNAKSKALEMAKNTAPKSLTAYGHTFETEEHMNNHISYMRQKSARSRARAKALSPQEKEDKATRAHFASEAKHFRI